MVVLIQLLIALALLPGCLKKEELVYSRTNETLGVLGAYSADRTSFRSDFMKLAPGVYQVRVYSDVQENQKMSVELCYETGPYRAVKTNSVTVFPNDGYIDFKAYVSYEIPNAYLQFAFEYMDISGVLQVDVWRTNAGSRLLLFAVLCGFAILDGMLIFRKRILEGSVTREQQIVFWVMAGIVLLSYFPYLTDYYFYVGDLGVHLSRIAHLKDSLLAGGQFPVRIQSTWMFDHGYAISLFYGDLFLYLPAFLMIIGFSLMSAYKIFIFLVMVCSAYIAYRCFKRCVGNVWVALYGSSFYMLASYRLLNLYIRGALGEFLAMTFLPLVGCGVYLLYTQNVNDKAYKRHKWYLILGMSGILQCHNISSEMVVGFIFLVCVIGWKKTFRRQTFFQLLESVGLVIVLNAWYLVPFVYMMMVDSYKVNTIGEADILARALRLCEVFQLLPARVSLPFDEWGHMPASLGAGAGILLLGILFCKDKGDKQNLKPALAFCGVALMALLLCTDLIPWNILRDIPGIGYVVSSIQFPWRFMSVATAASAFFATFFCEHVRKAEGKLLRCIVGTAGAVVLATAIYQLNLVAVEEAPIYLYEEKNTGTIAIPGAEYLLKGNEWYEYSYHLPVAEEELDYCEYQQKGTNITLRLSNHSEGVRYLELPLIGYKGYSVDAEGTGEVPYITEQRGSHNDLRIAVPGGYEGIIHISYQGFPIFRVAELLSVVSLIVIIITSLYRKGKESKDEPGDTKKSKCISV